MEKILRYCNGCFDPSMVGRIGGMAAVHLPAQLPPPKPQAAHWSNLPLPRTKSVNFAVCKGRWEKSPAAIDLFKCFNLIFTT